MNPKLFLPLYDTPMDIRGRYRVTRCLIMLNKVGNMNELYEEAQRIFAGIKK